jgi:hypothetical protein
MECSEKFWKLFRAFPEYVTLYITPKSLWAEVNVPEDVIQEKFFFPSGKIKEKIVTLPVGFDIKIRSWKTEINTFSNDRFIFIFGERINPSDSISKEESLLESEN